MNIIMIVAVICAYIIKGMCGFANTLVFSTILGFTNNNIEITPVELIIGYPANLILCWKERKSLSCKVWLPLALMVIAGCIPGTFLLKTGNTHYIKIVFGLVVTGIGLEMYLRETMKKQQKSKPWVLGMIGIISGLLCGMFGIGALLAAYVSRTTDNTSSFRGNLCIVFLIENTFRLILYTMTGIITAATALTALKLIPFMIMGLAVGIGLSKVLSEKKVKKAVMILLMLSGISLIINNLI